MNTLTRHTQELSWDYTALAARYHLRAPYSQAALRDLFALMQLRPHALAADIGAGTGNLTAALVDAGFQVTAVEPNAAMRERGMRKVIAATWLATRGEATGLPDAAFDLVTFGSSFNVMHAPAALAESARLLRPGGWLAVLWNHRDLDDPRQRELQAVIEDEIAGYRHGSRREDPSASILAHGAFDRVECIEGQLSHAIDAADFVDGFRAHATLVRQAGNRLPAVLAALTVATGTDALLSVPFVTRIYASQRRHWP
jgi:ubiquinone/menaquinone biosynthesis C-methylase UbiE